jgi:hypothetical protein
VGLAIGVIVRLICYRARRLAETTERESEDSLPGVDSEDGGVVKV